MKKVLTIIVMLVVLACAVSAQTFGGRSSSSVYILPPHKMFFGEDDGTSPSLTKGGTNKLRLAGYFDFQLYPYTVATLPAASANRGRIYLVTDGSANTDCTGGGGSTYAVCVSDGVNWFALAGAAGAGSGDVTGPSSSVDSEVALFSGTSGKALKRAALTGLLKLTAGVASAASAGTDYAAPNASTTVNGQTCALGSTCTVADSTKVPTTTTVAGKALSGNITLAQTDLSAGNYTIGAYYIDQAEIAAPSNPSAGVCREYVDSTTHVKTWKNSSGTSCGPSASGGITNSASANVVMKSDGTNAVASSMTDTAGAVTGATSFTVAAGGNIGSADTGTPKFTFSANKITANVPFESTPPAGVGGYEKYPEGTDPGLSAAGYDVCYADSTAHAKKCSFNGDALSQQARFSDLAKAEATLTDGATITWAIASQPNVNAKVTLGGNRTLNITNPLTGSVYLLKVIQDATGSRTLTMGTGCTWKWKGGTAFTATAAANSVDIITFYYDGTNCYVNFGADYK